MISRDRRNMLYGIVDDELTRAIDKFPELPQDMHQRIAIVSEEMGEAIRAVNHYVWEKGSIEDVRTELIQTAAMCIRMLNSLDRTE